jgi:hypothetical protein
MDIRSEVNGRYSTWLELAVAPRWRLDRVQVQLHPLQGGRDHCLGITVDGRWLCANDGRLTVFGTRDSALRFLSLLHIEGVGEGDASDLLARCGCHSAQCLRLGRRGLGCCEGKEACELGGLPRAVQRAWPQSVPVRVDFMS